MGAEKSQGIITRRLYVDVVNVMRDKCIPLAEFPSREFLTGRRKPI